MQTVTTIVFQVASRRLRVVAVPPFVAASHDAREQKLPPYPSVPGAQHGFHATTSSGLNLQFTPGVCTPFGDTEVALVRHVAIGLGVLIIFLLNTVGNWCQVPELFVSLSRTYSLTAREATKQGWRRVRF